MTTPSRDPYDENYEPEKQPEPAAALAKESPWATTDVPHAAAETVVEKAVADPYADRDPYAAADLDKVDPTSADDSWDEQPAIARDGLWAPPAVEAEPFAATPFEAVSTDEGNRRSGLAYSAGIAFFASTAFMLFLGWLADLVLGSSPWGLVLGIVIGAAIGFIQFFRITSQIFEKEKRGHIKPLLSGHDTEPPTQP